MTRMLSGTGSGSYRVRLMPGMFARIRVDQTAVDIIAVVTDPLGNEVANVDANGVGDSEILEIDAEHDGDYHVAIRPFEHATKPVDYTITLVELRSVQEQAAVRAKERTQRKAVEEWVAVNAARLRTARPGGSRSDLEPLRDMVGRARIVALGEATHGTRDFFQLKHRVLEFLATEMGFTLFGIEATMPAAFAINRYVLTGEGDPEKALTGLYFWVYNTEEVLDMIRWMRRYNEDPRHDRKVQFYGIDMQFSPRAAEAICEFVRRVDPLATPETEKDLETLLNPLTSEFFDQLPDTLKDESGRGVQKVIQRMERSREVYASRSSEDDVEVALQHARILAQYVEMGRAGPRAGVVRDSAMAENIEWILRREGQDAKIVLWAHNFHVSKDTTDAVVTMGGRLRRKFGSELVVFGFAFNQGSFQANAQGSVTSRPLGSRAFEVGPAPVGSLDRTLADAGLGIAALDLRRIPATGEVREWFERGAKKREIGAVYTENAPGYGLIHEITMRRYDVLLFVNRTQASRSNPMGRRRFPPVLETPRNVDFENRGGEAVFGWFAPPQGEAFGYRVATTAERPHRGGYCAQVERLATERYGDECGRLIQRVEAGPFRGKRIRLSAAVRAEVPRSQGQVHLWLQIVRGGSTFASVAYRDVMADRPITTAEWQEVALVGDVPSDADYIEYGLGLVGKGKAWLDSVSVEGVEP